MLPRSLIGVLVGALVAATALSGCLTGERPTLADDSTIDAPVGDTHVDLVLASFAELAAAAFTATYRITNNFGPVEREATVVQTSDGRRSITVGPVRYLIEPGQAVTCVSTTPTDDADAVDTTCSDGVDDAAISDLQVTHQFYGRSAAARLRTDADRRVGDTEGSQITIAEQTADCVSVPVSGGSKVFCVLPEGILASYQGPDVLIELLTFDPTPDESFFTRSP